MGKKKVVDKSVSVDDVVLEDQNEEVLDLESEKKSLEEEEANQPLPEEASLQEVLNIDENTIEAESVEEGADADETLPAEVEAIHEDTTIAKALNRQVDKETDKKATAKETGAKVKKSKQNKQRSKRFKDLTNFVDKSKEYELDEAIELLKKTSTVKFDATVEAHISIDIKKQKNKTTESIRGVIKLPAGAIKVPKVIILNEEIADKILKTGKIDFDIALAKPEDMPKIARLAKILGPQGKMPNPKVGTVTDDPEKTKKEIEAGQIEYRGDSFNIVHAGIAKISWDGERIKANLKALTDVLVKYKFKSIYLTTSMGPSIRVKLDK